MNMPYSGKEYFDFYHEAADAAVERDKPIHGYVVEDGGDVVEFTVFPSRQFSNIKRTTHEAQK